MCVCGLGLSVFELAFKNLKIFFLSIHFYPDCRLSTYHVFLSIHTESHRRSLFYLFIYLFLLGILRWRRRRRRKMERNFPYKLHFSSSYSIRKTNHLFHIHNQFSQCFARSFSPSLSLARSLASSLTHV